ncbi:MAG: hypothetical protein M1818_001295 [Claussenomyces sp. TS43310]|nr:MAG: hypothetical protein M1818_001295 [Claussenomyces sp. TS43310]
MGHIRKEGVIGYTYSGVVDDDIGLGDNPSWCSSVTAACLNTVCVDTRRFQLADDFRGCLTGVVEGYKHVCTSLGLFEGNTGSDTARSARHDSILALEGFVCACHGGEPSLSDSVYERFVDSEIAQTTPADVFAHLEDCEQSL